VTEEEETFIMRFVHALAALALGSLTVLACAAPTDATESAEATAQSSEALTGTGGSCTRDSRCVAGDVCDLYCPVSLLPGHFHCEIAGGSCRPAATQTVPGLGGQTFTSIDGAHNITFTYSTDADPIHDTATTATFRKTDGCPQTGIHCNAIRLTTGTYSLDRTGKVVTLTSDLGGSDSLQVLAHPYDGLVDTGTSAQLYPN
jgi:hypothetical protein